ncbi:hypothetical protein [Breznakiella homolactica]|uniref:EfeO-type cupredoxin-like domain-containing protein n=1 Tax=Breznakiella homolactica TaxID=2798577 RepID=A0A7T7XM21_9SPIR|nr:hypothetical protein [Breznakiella homolactica]QQO08753.1 hypothetical protein JFL75_17770 [Breznakiella homolactica]
MKTTRMKLFTVMVLFPFVCAAAYAADELEVSLSLGYPLRVYSGDPRVFRLSVTNNEEQPLEHLEILPGESDDFTMVPDRTRIQHLDPGETAVIDLEVTAIRSRYFSGSGCLRLGVAAGGATVGRSFWLEIKPPRYFWSRTAALLGAAAVLAMVFIFIKLNREDTPHDR